MIEKEFPKGRHLKMLEAKLEEKQLRQVTLSLPNYGPVKSLSLIHIWWKKVLLICSIT